MAEIAAKLARKRSSSVQCRRWFLPLLAGILLGAGTRVARSGDAPAKPANPNVVILRSEKIVTLEKPSVTLAEMAKEFSRQTGRAITLDPKYQTDKTEYAFLLKGAALTRTLTAVAYLTDSVCERKGTGYLLRPISDTEKAGDITRYEAAVDTIYATLKRLPKPDPATATDDDKMVARWMDLVDHGKSDFPPFPTDQASNWKVKAWDKGFGITYSEHVDRDGFTSENWRTESWMNIR
ncbi:MAG TPA: hypothetical protein VGM37_15940 [Armatimonadota bacterium]|jgi:hypothetical protein